MYNIERPDPDPDYYTELKNTELEKAYREDYEAMSLRVSKRLARKKRAPEQMAYLNKHYREIRL